MVGKIVCSKAGRDKGKFMVVTKVNGNQIFVCDGKERPLSRPKLKNEKHLRFTNTTLEKEQFLTDKKLRRAIAIYRCAAETQKEEK